MQVEQIFTANDDLQNSLAAEKQKNLQLLDQCLKADKNDKTFIQIPLESDTIENKPTKPKKLTRIQKIKARTSKLQISQNWKQFLQKNESNNNKNSKNQNNFQQPQSKDKFMTDYVPVGTLEPTPGTFKGITPIISLDCEMVKCFGQTSPQLARISIVNYNGHIILDQFVCPEQRVEDFLYRWSGIRWSDIKGQPKFNQVKGKIEEIFKNRIIIGHSLENDFSALDGYEHPFEKIRDISKFSKFRWETNKPIALATLTNQHLNVMIQKKSHSSVEDARATMLLYRKFEDEFEKELKIKKYSSLKKQLLQDLKNKKIEKNIHKKVRLNEKVNEKKQQELNK